MKNEKYDLIVVGGGAAGLVAAVAAGAFGARTALVERNRLGGECSWTGCIPSKALLAAADLVHRARQSRWGGRPLLEEGSLRAAGVMQHVRDTVQAAARASKAGDLLKRYGVEIFYGAPKFLDRNTVELDGRPLRARRFVICTGSAPVVPSIAGLEPGYLTNQTVWDLPEPPDSLLVVGGGPIGVELAQAFHRLGTKVDLIHSRERLLPRDDGELAAELTGLLRQEGLGIHLSYRVSQMRKLEHGWQVEGREAGNPSLQARHLLLALGRQANVDRLNLEAAGVRYTEKGIRVDRFMRTSAPNIWAAGDCSGGYQFSHIAEIEAKTAVINALFPTRRAVDYQGAPWTTFTDPELAHLGLTEEECREQGLSYRVYTQPFAGDDRAITDGAAWGRVKILATPRGRILGAHILGPRAGELINELVLARRRNLRISDIGLTVHVYPTLGLAVQRATDEWFAALAEQPAVNRLLRLFSRRAR